MERKPLPLSQVTGPGKYPVKGKRNTLEAATSSGILVGFLAAILLSSWLIWGLGNLFPRENALSLLLPIFSLFWGGVGLISLIWLAGYYRSRFR